MSGIINGLFASGAGQILVFFLIYIIKIETHKARATSLICTTIATVVSIIGYSRFIDFEFKRSVTLLVIGFFGGIIGSKIMVKIESNKLNLMSGAIIAFFSLYSIFVR
ncbi:MAG: sulfite exporter TauE/SafE family protein [Clostridia bacterium]|nr:sulfite exporter TauE/SafE family protein [Clostridia bacterium]